MTLAVRAAVAAAALMTLSLTGSPALASVAAPTGGTPAMASAHPAARSTPAGRVWNSWAYDPAQQDIVLFGGDGGHGAGGPGPAYGDTWTWNGSWTEQHPATSPSRRDGAAMAWDPATGQLLLFGGGSAPSGNIRHFNDTWTWNGTTWTQLHPATSPSPREHCDMIYDAAMDEIILFAGGGVHRYLNQTWAWNGTTWTQLHPATSPAPRDTHSLVYDPATQTAILYGGFNTTSGRLSDTWSWDGTTWTQLHPATSPGVVSPAWQAAYDTASGQLILYGGDASTRPYRYATWTWNGTTWTRLHPATTPGPRGYGAMTYDQALNQIVLFGGSTGTTNPTCVWEWNGTTWHRAT